MDVVLVQADARRGSIVASFIRLGSGIAATALVVALGALLLFALVRPPAPPSVGGPGGSPSPSPAPTSSATPVAPPATISASPTVPVIIPAPSPIGPTATPIGPTPSPIGPTTGPQCRLAWSLGRVEGAAGSRYINVDAVNEGTAPCIISALIGVKLTAADGTAIAESTGPTAPAVTIDPGKRATGFVQWTNWCAAKPPAAPLTLVITEVDPVTQLAPLTPADPPPCTSPGNPSTVTPLQF